MRGWGPFTLRGIAVLVLIIACVVLADQLGLVELLAFGILLATLAAGSLVFVLALGLRADLERIVRPVSPTVDAESSVSVRVRVRSALARPQASWHDTVPAHIEGVGEGVFPGVRSAMRRDGDDVTLRYTVTARRRGIHYLGPLRVQTTDPFGLVRRRQQIGQPTRILVAPSVVDLVGMPPTDGDTGGTVHATTTRRGQGVDNLIARPYAPGDSMRRIHWRATAHRDELMVREEERETSPHATLLLDRAASRYDPAAKDAPGLDAAFEAAVVAYLSIARRFILSGYGITLVDSDGALVHDEIEGGDLNAFDELVTGFATVTTRGGPDVADAAARPATEGPLVVVTGALAAADGHALAPLARERDLAILCAASPATGAIEAATAAGWRALSATDDLRTSWGAMCQQGGSRAAP